MSSNKVTIGISCGDLNGVGIEILIKIFNHKDLLENCTPVLYCPINAIKYYKKKGEMGIVIGAPEHAFRGQEFFTVTADFSKCGAADGFSDCKQTNLSNRT